MFHGHHLRDAAAAGRRGPPAPTDLRSVDAFSISRFPRPLIVLTPNRTDDVYRHRFSAAHELGHLVLHGDASPGDIAQE
ncbi:ImmA/IrrE family metallo-endopeptidase, partial [Streptomyces sp. NRRL F-5555]|uniref:ImmA/IrrE family metallo-endopeptidase n=1 Tax=Streptomyces sp. NRRL F-5555 TaxID=1463863 RepID=UPI002277091F